MPLLPQIGLIIQSVKLGLPKRGYKMTFQFSRNQAKIRRTEHKKFCFNCFIICLSCFFLSHLHLRKMCICAQLQKSLSMSHRIEIMNNAIRVERQGNILKVIANETIKLESDVHWVLPIKITHPIQHSWGFYFPQLAKGLINYVENFTQNKQPQIRMDTKKLTITQGAPLGYLIFFKNQLLPTLELDGIIMTQNHKYISYSGVFTHTSQFYLNHALHFKQLGQKIWIFIGKSNFTRDMPMKGIFVNDQLTNSNNTLQFTFENTDQNHFNLKIGDKFVIFQQQQMRLSTVRPDQIQSMNYPNQTLGFDKFSTVQLNYNAFSTTDGIVKVNQAYQLSIYLGLHNHAQFKINGIDCQIVLQLSQLHLTPDLTPKYAITTFSDTQFAISFEDGKFLSVTENNGILIWQLTQQVFIFVEALSTQICFRWGADNLFISGAFGQSYLSVRPYDKQYVLKYNRNTGDYKIGEQQIYFGSFGRLYFTPTGKQMRLAPTTEQFTRLELQQQPMAVQNNYLRTNLYGAIFRVLSYPQTPELVLFNLTKVYLRDWKVQAGILMQGIPPANEMIWGYILGTTTVQKGYMFMNYRFKHQDNITCIRKDMNKSYVTQNTQIIFKISNIIDDNGQFTAEIECFNNINQQKKLQVVNGTIKTYNGTGQGSITQRIYTHYQDQIDQFEQIQMKAYSGGQKKVFQILNTQPNIYRTVLTKLNFNEYIISTVTYVYQDASTDPIINQLDGPFGIGYVTWQNINFPNLKPRVIADCETQQWHAIRIPVGNLILKRTPPEGIQWWIFCLNPLICGRLKIQAQGYWSLMEQ